MKIVDSISIKQATTPEELKQARAIRVKVLESEQGFPHNVNVDGLDQSADHVLLLDDCSASGGIKMSDLVFYRRLSFFFKDQFPEIKLASEVEKEMLIRELSSSPHFAPTHTQQMAAVNYTLLTRTCLMVLGG